ncbi:MAG: hypothetical protein JO293_04055, partial [Candidatus Eremiobacteraeota bacterium]|nr:hypothetical protein [Candidatus Eremiobacteraeota bacterium]
YYLFDLTSLSQRYVNQATLTLSTQNSGWACVKNLGPADSDWWTIQGVSGGDFQPVLIVSTSPTSAVYDVTSIVQAWANGADNHGFVLQGFREDDVSARGNGSCLGTFDGNATLTVTHS